MVIDYDEHRTPNIDGVVKSPICGVIVFGQTLDILYVCRSKWPNTMPCLWAFFHSHRATFYESINIQHRMEGNSIYNY